MTTHGALHPSTSRRCTAHSSRTGEPCKKWAVNGTNVCGTHGGKAPQVVAKARQRLQEAADRMAEKLLGMADNDDGKTPSYVQMQAINSALDRAGVAEPVAIDVTHELKPFEQILSDMDSIAGGSRADYRRSIGHPDPEPQSLPVGESNHHRPGGARVLGETFDGHLVLDGDVQAANPDQGEPEHQSQADDAGDDSQSGRQTLTNPVMPLIPLPSPYMPTESAMEAAQDANRAHRSQLRRR